MKFLARDRVCVRITSNTTNTTNYFFCLFSSSLLSFFSSIPISFLFPSYAREVKSLAA